MTEVHRTVLLEESIDALQVASDDIVVDATLGGAGHSKAIVARLGTEGALIGFDLDPAAIERAREALADAAPNVILIERNFRAMKDTLSVHGIEHIDKALFDLGWSSFQLAAGRGFSFQKDEPLLMTFGVPREGALTAAEVVNTWHVSSLTDIFSGWGEERFAKRIAEAIGARREKRPFSTARELADFIKESVPVAHRYGRLHPATRVFQALRIAVNDEMGALHEALTDTWRMLNPGGRIAVITFHSIEDRLVKQTFRDLETEGARKWTKKPIVPSRDEIMRNPRARSAKLRAIEKP